MKQSSIFQLALFYLVLLLSHESITVANTIRQTVGLRHGAKISNTLNNIVKYMENVDVDSFLEVENMHGMSAEAYGTLEMREMHKSLIEGFSFKHSPILDDLKTLNEIPENKILSPSELSQHRQDVTVLLEKAMTGWGAAKSLFKGASKVGGKAKDKVGDAGSAVKDKVGDAGSAAKDKLGDAKEGVDNIASGAVEKIKNETMENPILIVPPKLGNGQRQFHFPFPIFQCKLGRHVGLLLKAPIDYSKSL